MYNQMRIQFFCTSSDVFFPIQFFFEIKKSENKTITSLKKYFAMCSKPILCHNRCELLLELFFEPTKGEMTSGYLKIIKLNSEFFKQIASSKVKYR